jgi:hypothetical protein
MTHEEFKRFIQQLAAESERRRDVIRKAQQRDEDLKDWVYHSRPWTTDATKPEPKPQKYVILARTPLPPKQIGGRCDGCLNGMSVVSYSLVGGDGMDHYCEECDTLVLKSLPERDDLEVLDVDYTEEVV